MLISLYTDETILKICDENFVNEQCNISSNYKPQIQVHFQANSNFNNISEWNAIFFIALICDRKGCYWKSFDGICYNTFAECVSEIKYVCGIYFKMILSI